MSTQEFYVERVAPLAGLTNLRHLEVWKFPIADAAAAHLGKLVQLTWLELHVVKPPFGRLQDHERGKHVEVGAAFLQHLCSLAKLESLSLENAALDAAAAAELMQLSNLRTLTLRHSKLADGVAEQLERLPNLTSFKSLWCKCN